MSRTQIATDAFTRATLNSTGDWAQLNSAWADVQIYSSVSANGAGAWIPTNNNCAAARWVGAGTFTDNQYASVAFSGLAFQSQANWVGPVVRASADIAGARDYYFAAITADSAGPTYTTFLCKCLDSTITTLYSAAVTWSNGDTLDLEVSGTTLTVCKNGTALGGSWTQTGQADLTTGLPGIAGSGGSTSIMATDWYAGSVSSASAAPIVAYYSMMNRD